MTCREARKRLSSYQDGELDPRLERRVRTHIESCSACAGILADLSGLWSTLDIWETVEPIKDFEARFLRISARRASRDTAFRRILRRAVPAPALAGALLFIAGLAGGFALGTALFSKAGAPVSTIVEGPETATFPYLDAFDDPPAGSLMSAYLQVASEESVGKRRGE